MDIPKKYDMPVLGLGTWQMQGDTVIRAVKHAIELGYDHIDTAEAYENEQDLSEAIQGRRNNLFITSKVMPPNLRHDSVIKACQASLARLKTDYLDQYLIHWPNKDVPIEETLGAFKELLESGRIRSMGVSNFTVRHLKEAIPFAEKLGIRILSNQVEYHPYLNQEELLEFCNDHDIALVAYSPLARGEILEDETLARIGGKHEKTSAQVALRWLIQKGIVAIPKSSSEKHLASNIDIFDFELDSGDMKGIDSIKTEKRLIKPGWAEFDA